MTAFQAIENAVSAFELIVVAFHALSPFCIKKAACSGRFQICQFRVFPVKYQSLFECKFLRVISKEVENAFAVKRKQEIAILYFRIINPPDNIALVIMEELVVT